MQRRRKERLKLEIIFAPPILLLQMDDEKKTKKEDNTWREKETKTMSVSLLCCVLFRDQSFISPLLLKVCVCVSKCAVLMKRFFGDF